MPHRGPALRRVRVKRDAAECCAPFFLSAGKGNRRVSAGRQAGQICRPAQVPSTDRKALLKACRGFSTIPSTPSHLSGKTSFGALVSMSKKWRCRRHCCHSIVAGTTAVVSARFVSHLRVANRLRRLCPLGDGELFKFYLKSSVCQRQTGLPKGQPALRLPCGACRGFRAARRSGHPVDATAEGS